MIKEKWYIYIYRYSSVNHFHIKYLFRQAVTRNSTKTNIKFLQLCDWLDCNIFSILCFIFALFFANATMLRWISFNFCFNLRWKFHKFVQFISLVALGNWHRNSLFLFRFYSFKLNIKYPLIHKKIIIVFIFKYKSKLFPSVSATDDIIYKKLCAKIVCKKKRWIFSNTCWWWIYYGTKLNLPLLMYRSKWYVYC